MEEFKEEVKVRQEKLGEQDFDWKKSTEELSEIVLGSMKEYLSNGETKHIIGQLPSEIKSVLSD